MRKIFGIVAIALLLSAPAFGQQINYYLQLQADDTNGGSSPFVAGSETDGLVVPASNKLTWSVRAVASGQIGGVNVLGAANLVWDLYLTKDGETVTVGDTGSACPLFGKGDASTTGFYSVFNAGPDPDPVEAAAFAFQAFGISGNATVIDATANGGPNMARFQFPSTYQFANGAQNLNCTAKSGTLMGMGAGYPQFLNDPLFGEELGGVALAGCQLGGTDPAGGHIIAEGQLNLTNMPTGANYTLKLVPGKGNNLLRGDAGFDCNNPASTAGPFAGAGLYDGTPTNVYGDTISFTTAVVEVAPIASAAESRKQHGTVGNFPIALALTGTALVECRVGATPGPSQIVVTYGNMTGIAGTIGVTPVNATLNGAPSVSGNQLTINLTGAVDRTCVALTITGVANAADTSKIAASHVIKVTALKGDVDGNHAVGASDISAVKAKSSLANVTALNFWYDLDCTGKTQASDISVVKALSRLGTITCAN